MVSCSVLAVILAVHILKADWRLCLHSFPDVLGDFWLDLQNNCLLIQDLMNTLDWRPENAFIHLLLKCTYSPNTFLQNQLSTLRHHRPRNPTSVPPGIKNSDGTVQVAGSELILQPAIFLCMRGYSSINGLQSDAHIV